MDPHAEELLASCSVSEQNRLRKPTSLKPIHRLMAFAVANGRSRTELAEDTGFPFEEIRKVTETEMFQDAVSEFILEQGEDLLQKRIDASVLDSLNTMIELRDNPATKDAIRFQAANTIMNRKLGTPTQHIIAERRVQKDPLTEMEEIDQQLQQYKEVTKKHDVKLNHNTSNSDPADTYNSPVPGETDDFWTAPTTG